MFEGPEGVTVLQKSQCLLLLSFLVSDVCDSLTPAIPAMLWVALSQAEDQVTGPGDAEGFRALVSAPESCTQVVSTGPHLREPEKHGLPGLSDLLSE